MKFNKTHCFIVAAFVGILVLAVVLVHVTKTPPQKYMPGPSHQIISKNNLM